MQSLLKGVLRMITVLNENRTVSLGRITDVKWMPCGYRKSDEMPDDAALEPFDTEKDTWGNGYDAHAWFRFAVDVPEDFDNIFLSVATSKVGAWDPDNPQLLVWVDGKLEQGMDINHTRLYFRSAGHHEITVYAYTGIKTLTSFFRPELFRLNREVEKLWYDIKVPYDAVSYQETYSAEYRSILTELNRAILLLDLYEVPSEAFFASVRVASEWMDAEFYGKFCHVSE